MTWSLQWDRTREGAEVPRETPLLGMFPELQWDRTREGAEVRAPPISPRPTSPLQWDRTREGAEVSFLRFVAVEEVFASMGPHP